MVYKTFKVTNNTGENLSDFQISIQIDNVSNFTDIYNDIDDTLEMYLTDGDGNPIDYWIEKPAVSGAGYYILWFKQPTFNNGDTVFVRFYYNENTNPYLSYNNPEGIFDFFDNFSSDPGSNGKWTINSCSNYNYSDYCLKLTNCSFQSNTNFSYPVRIITEVSYESTSYQDKCFFQILYSSNNYYLYTEIYGDNSYKIKYNIYDGSLHYEYSSYSPLMGNIYQFNRLDQYIYNSGIRLKSFEDFALSTKNDDNIYNYSPNGYNGAVSFGEWDGSYMCIRYVAIAKAVNYSYDDNIENNITVKKSTNMSLAVTVI